MTYSSPYHQYLLCFYSFWFVELLQNVDRAGQFSSESQVCPNWFAKYWRAVQRFSLQQWWRNSICDKEKFNLRGLDWVVSFKFTGSAV